MSLLRKNIAANYGGQLLMVLVGILVVPVYLRFLGPEAYGLVTFFVSLQAVTSILDMGLSTTANREVSKVMVRPDGAAEAKDVLRTLEVVYYGMAFGLCICFAAIADWLGSYWIKAQELSPATISKCASLAGVSIAMRWPVALYSGMLRGLEKQVRLNVLTSAIALGKAAGSVAVLAWISNDVVSFYWYQLLFTALETSVMAWAAWRSLPLFNSSRGRYRGEIVSRIWRFAFGVGWITAFALVIKQGDKVIVSKLCSIEQVGFYGTAAMAGLNLVRLVQPVQAAVFPRFTALLEVGRNEELSRVFRRSSELVAFIASPVASLMAVFPEELLHFWTRSEVLAVQAGPALVFFAVAMLLNSVMSVPFSVQLAAGMTWLPLRTNGFGALVLLPLTWYTTLKYGIAGAAFSWLCFNLVYYFVIPHIFFRHILQGQKRAWYCQDTMPYMVFGLASFGAARLAGGGKNQVLWNGMLAGLAALVYLVASLCWSDRLRDMVRSLPLIGKLPSSLLGRAKSAMPVSAVGRER